MRAAAPRSSCRGAVTARDPGCESWCAVPRIAAQHDHRSFTIASALDFHSNRRLKLTARGDNTMSLRTRSAVGMLVDGKRRSKYEGHNPRKNLAMHNTRLVAISTGHRKKIARRRSSAPRSQMLVFFQPVVAADGVARFSSPARLAVVVAIGPPLPAFAHAGPHGWRDIAPDRTRKNLRQWQME